MWAARDHRPLVRGTSGLITVAQQTKAPTVTSAAICASVPTTGTPQRTTAPGSSNGEGCASPVLCVASTTATNATTPAPTAMVTRRRRVGSGSAPDDAVSRTGAGEVFDPTEARTGVATTPPGSRRP